MKTRVLQNVSHNRISNDKEALNGFDAKRFARGSDIRAQWGNIANWDVHKLEIMQNLVAQKFKNPILFAKLKEIQEEIVEDTAWGDFFWGKCNGIGENHLGKILMEIRDAKTEV